MRIAQVAPLYESVPPKLLRRHRAGRLLPDRGARPPGHEVTLFASGDSVTTARLVAAAPALAAAGQALRRPARAPHPACSSRCSPRAAEFDVVHFHVDYLHFPLSRRPAVRARDDAARAPRPPRSGAALPEFRDMPLVSISDAQREPLPWANWQRDRLPRAAAGPATRSERAPATYLAFLGRISPEKRVDRAIEIARRVGMPLKIAGQGRSRRTTTTSRRSSSRCSTRPLGRVHRRDRRRRRRTSSSGNALRAALPDRLAGAVRPGHDRGDGLRHAGHRVPARLGARGHGGRRHGLRRGRRSTTRSTAVERVAATRPPRAAAQVVRAALHADADGAATTLALYERSARAPCRASVEARSGDRLARSIRGSQRPVLHPRHVAPHRRPRRGS